MTWRLLGILHPDAELGALLGVLHPEAELGAAPRIYGAEAVSDNTKGLALAVASSAFIGASFILKKIGLLRAAKCGARAGTAPLPRCRA